MTTSARRRRGRGGRGGHEPRARIRLREVRAEELTAQGWSQAQIAEDLGVSQPAVSKILKRIETRHVREQAETVGRQRARHGLRLEHVFSEAIGAWHASKADRTRRRQRKTQGGHGPEASVAEIVIEHQHGDPRYLEEARKALADHRKLWGLDAPQKLDLRAAPNPYDGMSEDALRAELARQTPLLGAADPPVIDAVTTADPTLPRPHVEAVFADPAPSSTKESAREDQE